MEETISFFCCPVCGQPLHRQENTLSCRQGHSFDMARRGYVNLLLNAGPREKRHGDDAMMARARRAFLEKGYYDPLADALCTILAAHVPADARVLDCGCGECFYTQRAAAALPGRVVAGVDISRAMVSEGAKRQSGIELAVASAFSLPVADGSCGAVMQVFAPLAPGEFARALSPEGVLVSVVPTQRHLWELKCAVYSRPYENPPVPQETEGFTLCAAQQLSYRVKLESGAAIDALFRMTPYYYKTSRQDQQKLSALAELETQLGFEVRVYRPSCSASR